MPRRSRWSAPTRRRSLSLDGDTIWMGAVDAQRLGRQLHPVGLLGFRLRPGAAENRSPDAESRHLVLAGRDGPQSALAPGRKPFHTLNPALALFADGRVMPYGTMGGDAQPQIQAQLFSRYRLRRRPRRSASTRRASSSARRRASAIPCSILKSRFDDGRRRRAGARRPPGRHRRPLCGQLRPCRRARPPSRATAASKPCTIRAPMAARWGCESTTRCTATPIYYAPQPDSALWRFGSARARL